MHRKKTYVKIKDFFYNKRLFLYNFHAKSSCLRSFFWWIQPIFLIYLQHRYTMEWIVFQNNAWNIFRWRIFSQKLTVFKKKTNLKNFSVSLPSTRWIIYILHIELFIAFSTIVIYLASMILRLYYINGAIHWGMKINNYLFL